MATTKTQKKSTAKKTTSTASRSKSSNPSKEKASSKSSLSFWKGVVNKEALLYFLQQSFLYEKRTES